MRLLPSLVLIAALAAGAAEAGTYRAPRTAFGTPDLQGLWTNTALTFLARPPIFKGLIATEAEEKMMKAGFNGLVGDILKPTADPNAPVPPVVKEVANADFLEMDLNLARINGERRSSWIVEPADGKIPFTDAGRKAARAASKDAYDGPEGRPLSERCLIAVGSPEGPPMLNTGFNAHYQIIQTKDHVAIEIEMNHDVRIIRMSDRKHAPAAVSQWLGDSIGWWDGDTLVVETANLRPGAMVGSLNGSFAYGPKTRITERFTRTAADQILYEFTVEDVDYYKRPFSAQMPMRPAKGPIYEYACHEGNYGVANALAGARYGEAHPQPATKAAVPAPAPAPAAKPAK